MSENTMDRLLRFYEKLARRLLSRQTLLRVIGFISLGGLLEALWVHQGLHQLFYFIGITWAFGLSLLIPIYLVDEEGNSWIRQSSEIVGQTMAFFTTLWYIILTIISVAIIIKLILVA
jgi:hypothetical protein